MTDDDARDHGFGRRAACGCCWVALNHGNTCPEHGRPGVAIRSWREEAERFRAALIWIQRLGPHTVALAHHIAAKALEVPNEPQEEQP